MIWNVTEYLLYGGGEEEGGGDEGGGQHQEGHRTRRDQHLLQHTTHSGT